MKSLAFALVLLSALPALAETREERVAVANDYVELALAGFDMDAVIETMYQPILQQVAQGGQTLTDAQVEEIRLLYSETFSDPMLVLMRDQSEIMADIMTLAEITALHDFYATPEGRSAMAKLPELTAAQQPGMIALMNENMDGLMPKVLAIINGE